MKKSIYIAEEDNYDRYTGKIIGEIFYRNFNFSRAVLWQNKELSMDKRVFDYVKNHIKKIVFMDTPKRMAYKIGIKQFINHMRVDSYGRGEQVYIFKDILTPMKTYPEVPYVAGKYIVNEVRVIKEANNDGVPKASNVLNQRKKLKDMYKKVVSK